MRGRQAGLRPAAVEATAFLGDLGRDGYGMKMKGQEKDREKQQQPDDAASPVRAGFRARDSHDSFSTQVATACQSRNSLPICPSLPCVLKKTPAAQGQEPARFLSNSPITKNNLGTGDL